MINIKMQDQVTDIHALAPKIAVIGVGGAGGNAVNNMISSNLEGCEFIVCNTDAQALQGSLCDDRVQLGVNITGGLGAGSKPEVGKAAAEESLEEVLRFLDGANMAFVTAGMGGGTGTGAAPVIAKACREQGILTVGVVTKPFHFEGAHRMQQAEKGLEEMQQYVDTLIVIPNQNLFRIASEKTTFAEAFKMADSVLQSGVRGVTDLMVRPGMINLDFADIRTAMQQMGKAMMGTGEASGDKRAIEAAEAAINNPLLDDVSMKGAEGVIINVTGGYDMTLFEADEACNRVRDEVDSDANIIFGATFDDSMDGMIRVSIVATGIEKESAKGKITTGGTGTSGGGVDRSTPNTGAGNTGGGMVAVSSAATAQKSNTAMRPMVSVPSDNNNANISAETGSMPMTSRDVLRNLKAPSPVSAGSRDAGGNTPSQQQQQPGQNASTSIDMFEQAEFSGSETGEDLYASQNTILRGTRYKESFIPPKPMEADIDVPENGIGSHISSFHGEHAKGAQAQQRQPSSSGLQLNPPRPASPERSEKRAPSLFERITGSVQHHIDTLREESEAPRARPLTGDSTAAQSVPSPARPSLNLGSPAGKPGVKIDDELDIPAFLRRQAN